MKILAASLVALTFSSSVAHTQFVGFQVKNGYWEVQLKRGLTGKKCEMHSFQSGLSFYLYRDSGARPVVSFFGRGQLDEELRHIIKLRFDGEEFPIDARTMVLEDDKIIARSAITQERRAKKFFNQLKYSYSLTAVSPDGDVFGKWSLAGSAKALTNLGLCENHLK